MALKLLYMDNINGNITNENIIIWFILLKKIGLVEERLENFNITFNIFYLVQLYSLYLFLFICNL